MGHGVLGRKLGMTQIWDAEGNRIPVTIVQAGPCTVIQVKRADGTDGYNAVQVAYEPVAERKITKPEAGVFKRLSERLSKEKGEEVVVGPHRHLREFRLREGETTEYAPGDVYDVDHLKAGNFVDVVGVSKGHGYTGVMKRWGFHGADSGHGAHEAYRHPGTGGQGSATPARVPRGAKRPGQHGASRSIAQNVLVVKVDKNNRLVYLQGSIPGPKGGLVEVREAIKTPDI